MAFGLIMGILFVIIFGSIFLYMFSCITEDRINGKVSRGFWLFTLIAIIFVHLVILFSSIVQVSQDSFKDGYKHGQVDYINGVIKFKAVPATQTNYEETGK